MKLLRKQLSVANLLSGLALFLALGGAAYAAKTTLSKNAVKTRNIANGAVTTPKLRNGAVKTAKLRNQAVSTAKLRSGAVGTGQLANGAVRSGQLGGGVVTTNKLKNNGVSEEKIAGSAVTNSKLGSEAVATGKIEKGAVSAEKINSGLLAQLVKDVSYVNAATAENNEDDKEITAECPPGKEAIGGGARISGELKDVALTGSNPFVSGDDKRTGWSAFAREFPIEAGVGKWYLEAFAVCAEL